jgi:hypothetical protein
MKSLFAAFILLTLLVTLQAVRAGTDAPYAINWWTSDAGGGASTGGGYSLSGTAGQAETGSLRSGSYRLEGGYWAGTQVALQSLYLPCVLNNFVSYFEGPFEQEPNNTADQANGLLRSGRVYQGYPNDANDYFDFKTNSSGIITVDLTNHTGTGVQLLLYGPDPSQGYIAIDQTPPYHFDYSGPPGLYYLRIYTAAGYNTNSAYSLTVTFP